MTTLERTITEVAARCLRTEVPIDKDTPFDLLGLDSLATIELAAALEAELGRELPADLLAECSDARLLAAWLSREGVIRPAEDPYEQMFADAVLPEDVRPLHVPRASADLREARRILVTGATGFLGGALVEELLRQTSATLVCLVRDPARFECTRPDRIEPLQGNLTHPRLGLSRARSESLAADVDAVLHCGAAVNWVFSYSALRHANVLGTLELLRLACQARASFHFVSSLSVCYAADGPRTADETFNALPHLRNIHLGYAQTKVVGEALVRQAGERGLRVRMYRPAFISGHSSTGAYNRDDLIPTLVRGCVAMSTAPDLDWKLDAQPVDVVAQSLVALSKDAGPVFHIAHQQPRHWRECVLWMRMYGYDVRLISYPAWLRQLERETKLSPEHPLRPLRSFFTDRPDGGRGLTLPELYEERRRTAAVCKATDVALEASGVCRPSLDAALLDTYFSAFIAGGDLPPPVGRPAVGRVFRLGRPGNAVPDLIATTLRASGITCAQIEILSNGSDHSIVSELTAWRSRRPSGLFRARITTANGRRRHVMVKIKAVDDDVMAVGEAVAEVVDPAVGAAYRRWGHQVGFAASHAREIAIYRQEDARFRRHVPSVLASVASPERDTWIVILEQIEDATLLDSASHPERWGRAEIAAAIEGLATLQSIWFGREAELRQQPWIGHVHSTRSMAEMTELWATLARHAAPFFSAWGDPELSGIHRRLVDRVADWWSVFDGGPRTLIHNDFNPRNICLRGSESTLCAYDWELATIGAPQHDLAEFLCFVLTEATIPDAGKWIELHRSALSARTGVDLDPELWLQGFRSVLCDLLVNRLATYCMVHRVRAQSFLPRVVNTWRRLYREVGLEGSA